jgi:metalloendopeptidase OMA1, mitochondrial
MTRHQRRAAIGGLLLLGLAVGCATAPYTNRSQLILLPESEEVSLGAQAYQQVLSKEKIDHDPKVLDPVHDVGERIARVSDRRDYKWTFTAIDDPKTVNAFCLPGGKIAVYTGLFPVAHDTAGLAAVLGHEVGHALAHHAAERMSQSMAAEAVGAGLSVALGAQDPATHSVVMQAFGLGAQVGVLLPFSRTQEAEADHIGLILMAKAGYDPHAALALWQRFEKVEKSAPPEFLSTHPNYGTRESNIRTWMSEAMGYYHPDAGAKVEPLPTIPASAAR